MSGGVVWCGVMWCGVSLVLRSSQPESKPVLSGGRQVSHFVRNESCIVWYAMNHETYVVVFW